jgi:hypothetical protein
VWKTRKLEVFFSRFLREKFTQTGGIWRKQRKKPWILAHFAGGMARFAILQEMALSVLLKMQIE